MLGGASCLSDSDRIPEGGKLGDVIEIFCWESSRVNLVSGALYYWKMATQTMLASREQLVDQ